MREEVVSSGGPTTATHTVSSVGASSPAFPTNARNVDGSSYGHVSMVASVSFVGSQQPWMSLSTIAGDSAFESSQASCRPWAREDLLRRLSTFKPFNWSGKPKVASSLACAQRGWINVDVDKIACEACNACLSFVRCSTWTSTEVENAGEAFANQLDTGHKMKCPWRGNSCPESLVQFPPAPQPALVGGYKDRCDGLLQFQSLPVVPPSAVEQMRAAQGVRLERFLSQPPHFIYRELDFRTESAPDVEHSRDNSVCLYSQAQKLISLCGWEARWLPNVQDCEEHSALSARNGCSFCPTSAQGNILHDPGPSKNGFSASGKKGIKQKTLVGESRDEMRSPLLDCSLCGATVKILDFLTVPQPSRIASSNIDIPDTSKRIALTRGASAASGIDGWADDTEKEQIEDRDEVATTSERRSLPNGEVDLNLIGAGGSSSLQLGRTATSGNFHDAYIVRDPMIGQASGSEVGGRVASYESRGPSSRKRSLEIGGSSDERTQLLMQQVDSIEGVVIDRDNDEVADERQCSAGPSKRICDSDMLDTYSSYSRDSSGAGPSCSKGLEIYADANRIASYRQESEQNIGGASTRDSLHASSVIAMDTLCNGGDDISQDSVENNPGDVDDIHFPSSSMYGNMDMNEASELNYSNQVQQSICLQPVAGVVPGEMGVSSTNVGEENSNAETVDPRRREGFSFGFSGGSVGMCASHEAEIHGTGVSAIRADSVGDVGPKLDDVENQGQMGDSVPGPGLMDEIIPEILNREDRHAESQGMFQSTRRADSGSKVDGSTKAESFESGEKISETHKLPQGNMEHPSASFNAIVHSGYATSKEVTGVGTTMPVKDSVYLDCVAANGPSKGESNYEEASEFDPIKHHNVCCPWVNGNVAAAGSNSPESSANVSGMALCGWQLLLDALDAVGTSGNFPSQTLPSESAASLHKDDHQNPGKKLLELHSISRSRGQH